MDKGQKNLTLAYEGCPLAYQTVGIPPKAGAVISEARVRLVYAWPGEPNYVVVILEPP
jgi:hypothetical protein